MGDVVTIGTADDPIQLDIFQRIISVKWRKKGGVLVVDMLYDVIGETHIPYPIFPVSVNFMFGNFNWLEIPNIGVDGNGLPQTYPPETYFGSSGTQITQNSHHRYTAVPTGEKEYKKFLDEHYMWQQARMDFLADFGVPTGRYGGNGTLYFNLARIGTQLTPNALGIKTFTLNISNYLDNSVGYNAMGKVRAATYQDRTEWPLDGTPQSNDDLRPMWPFNPTAADQKSFTCASNVYEIPNFTMDVKSSDVKIVVTSSPPFNQDFGSDFSWL